MILVESKFSVAKLAVEQLCGEDITRYILSIIILSKFMNFWVAKMYGNNNGTLYVTGFTKTVLIGTRNEIQFIADY